MKLIKLLVVSVVLGASTNTYAVVINTLNGIQYEWLEVTETLGLSRLEVEGMLEDPTSRLYGYQYASRDLVEQLYLSYAPWDGELGHHIGSEVVDGVVAYMNDFGVTYEYLEHGFQYFQAADDDYEYHFFDRGVETTAFYGLPGECLEDVNRTCFTRQWLLYDGSTPVGAYQSDTSGWDATTYPNGPSTMSIDSAYPTIGSMLYRVAPVPVPAAAWLFGSGLMGLIAISRRKKTK